MLLYNCKYLGFSELLSVCWQGCTWHFGGIILPWWNHPIHCRGLSISGPINDSYYDSLRMHLSKQTSLGVRVVMARIPSGLALTHFTAGESWKVLKGPPKAMAGVGTRPKKSERAQLNQGGIRLGPFCGGKQRSWEQGECLSLNEHVKAVRAVASENQGLELEQRSNGTKGIKNEQQVGKSPGNSSEPWLHAASQAARVWQRGREGHWLWTAPRSHILTSSPLLPGLNRAAATQQTFHCHPYHCGYNPQMRLTERSSQVLQSDPQGHLDCKEGKGSKTAREETPPKHWVVGPWAWTHCHSLISWLKSPWPYQNGNGQGHCEATYSFVSSLSLLLNLLILLCHFPLYKQP